jgi:predicted AAA+ superfamily ATPase
LLENLIYLALCRAGHQVFMGVLPNKEVDFVAKKRLKPCIFNVPFIAR